MFNWLKAKFHFLRISMDTLIEAVAAIVMINLFSIYVVGNDSIINSSDTIGAIVVPIIQAVLLVVSILIAIGLLRMGTKTTR